MRLRQNWVAPGVLSFEKKLIGATFIAGFQVGVPGSAQATSIIS